METWGWLGLRELTNKALSRQLAQTLGSARGAVFRRPSHLISPKRAVHFIKEQTSPDQGDTTLISTRRGSLVGHCRGCCRRLSGV